MASNEVTVGAAVRYAWSLLSSRWRLVWGVLALNATAATASATGDLARIPMLQLAAMPALLMTMLMVHGALYRLAFADRHPNEAGFTPGHHGLQWGRIEWRMLGAVLLMAAFIIIIGLIVLIALAALLAGVLLAMGVQPRMGMTPDQVFAPLGLPPAAVRIAISTVLVALAAYLGLRLSLSLPATADQKAVRVLRTWKLTRGRFVLLLLTTLMIQLPVLLLSGWLALNLVTMEGTSQDASPTSLLLAAISFGIPSGLFVTPMMAGVSAYFYRAFGGPEAAQADDQLKAAK